MNDELFFKLHDAIEAAIQEAAEDTGYSEDEITYDIAMSVLQQWPHIAIARQYARVHGWSIDL